MSTATTQPGSTAGLPESLTTAITAEQRIAIRGASWDLYDQISEAIGEKQRVVVAFDGKDIEIMTKWPVHEDFRHLVTDFLSIVSVACGIRGRRLGETT